MLSNPEVGDKVKLTDEGLECIFSTSMGLQFMKNKTFTITYVERMGPDCFCIEVDDTDLNQYFLYNGCFEKL